MQELGFCGKKGRPCRAGLDGLQRFPDLQSTRLFPPPKASLPVVLLLESASLTVFLIPLPQKHVSRQLFFLFSPAALEQKLYLLG